MRRTTAQGQRNEPRTPSEQADVDARVEELRQMVNADLRGTTDGLVRAWRASDAWAAIGVARPAYMEPTPVSGFVQSYLRATRRDGLSSDPTCPSASVETHMVIVGGSGGPHFEHS